MRLSPGRKPRSILAAVLLLCVIGALLRGQLRESIAVIALCVSVPVLIIVYMTFVDWLGRGDRIGNRPHCVVCDYDVSALTHDACPECGTRRCAETTVYGERQRRPVAATIAVAGSLAMFSAITVAATTTVLIWIARCVVTLQ